MMVVGCFGVILGMTIGSASCIGRPWRAGQTLLRCLLIVGSESTLRTWAMTQLCIWRRLMATGTLFKWYGFAHLTCSNTLPVQILYLSKYSTCPNTLPVQIMGYNDSPLASMLDLSS